jgi:hypothetical protein
LAPSAGAKYRSLQQSLDETHALLRLLLDQERDLGTRRSVIASALNSRDPALPENDAAIGRLQQQLMQLDREHEALEKKRARLNSARGNLDQVLSYVRNVLPSCYGAPAADPVTATPRHDETLSDAILRTRGEIARKQQELVAIKSAPWPASETRAWLRAEIARLAKNGPRLAFGSDGRPEIVSPDIMQFTAPGVGLTAPSGSALRLMASLFPDQLLQCLEQQIIDAPGAVAVADRPARIREIEQQILKLEYEEESLLVQAQAAGLEVHRRPQASAHAILGLRSPILPPPLLEAAE